MNHVRHSDPQEILASPLPGKVVKILVQEGEQVQEGQSVFIIESLKMVHELRVPKPGKLKRIRVNVGDVVVADNQLATVE